jgi:hypothetical protein
MAIPALRNLTREHLDVVVGHPAQRRCLVAIAALLTDLRSCTSAAEYDELQRELFRHIWQTESRRADIGRCP